LIAVLITASLFLSQDSTLKTVQSSGKAFGGPVLSNSASALALASVLSSGGPEITPFEENEETLLIGSSAFLDSYQPVTKLQESKNDYFIIPTTGWNWGQIHYNNAIDVANSCGTPVFAAAEGLITESDAKGWNDGYGQYIIIEHPNGTETLYAHLDENVAPAGKYVSQGELIGYMGATGNTHGPTGCHLHFEVHGTSNPLAK